MATSRLSAGMTSLLALAALLGSGCATKKFVRQQTAPIAERIEQVNSKHAQALADLEQKESRDVSRVDERAMGAENKANDAAQAARQADGKAVEAARIARGATDLANQAAARAGELSNVVQNIGRYKLLTSEDVLFGFDRAVLTKESAQKLDQLSEQTKGVERCVLEVQGFTDRTGSEDYNLSLSRRRADAVVRYLVDRGVPLHRVHVLGLGEAQAPEPALSRREAAKKMRRVVVSLYAPEVTLSPSSPTSQTASVH